jgi:hypothetical protein
MYTRAERGCTRDYRHVIIIIQVRRNCDPDQVVQVWVLKSTRKEYKNNCTGPTIYTRMLIYTH